MNVKICGLTTPADAELALALGAGYLGCVVATDSPRTASSASRRAIRELARGRARFVLVTRGLPNAAVVALANDCEPDLVQCHEVAAAREHELAALLRCPLLRVRQVPAAATTLPRIAPPPSADAPIVLDGGRGGAGERFAWSLLAGGAPAHAFVAGGITPARLPELLAFAPWGIDVSSGIERAPGRKDPGALRELFAALEVAR